MLSATVCTVRSFHNIEPLHVVANLKGLLFW